RFSLIASFVTFAHRDGENGAQVWSEQAKALLAYAPDPRSVLAEFIERFRPMSWSGSRAALMESNARLLDSLEEEIARNLAPFITETKARIARDIEEQREHETTYDRVTDERFE
ncbi:hypothetical protein ACQV5M_18915, partial [Leptospira sp. SA-E8]|uniref:hypothetical protein n=1 Tax=Leptospira sp. SA-E8 TaxID=3422259 RepID=UPI003EBB06EC